MQAAPAAEAEFRWEYLAFGTLAAAPFQEKGFERTTVEPFSDSYAVVKSRPQILLRWSAPAPRVAVIDAAPPPGAPPAAAEVSLNSSPVGRLVLQEDRRRYAIPLPAEAQRPGGNRLHLDFSAAPTGKADAAAVRPAARLYGLSVGPAGDADLDWLTRDGAPPPFGIAQSGTSRAVVQAGPSAVRYAFRAPARAELRFTPELHPRARAARAAAVFSVSVGARAGAEREVWRRRVAAADTRADEVALDLPFDAGDAGSLVLRVAPDGGSRPAWGLWQGLRVMGDPTEEAGPGGPSSDPTSVLLVILDAAGAKHFGCYGYARRTTLRLLWRLSHSGRRTPGRRAALAAATRKSASPVKPPRGASLVPPTAWQA